MIDTFVNHPFQSNPKIYKINDTDILFIDSYSYTGNIRLCIYNLDQNIHIGKFCSIANDVEFTLVENHFMSGISTYPFENIFPNNVNIMNNSSPHNNITIGNDVWIGRGAKIMSGVKISDGVIIGANCQVSKDIPPYAKVIGNPMKIIGYRFNPEDIETLLKLKWWNYDIDFIGNNLKYMYQSDVFRFASIFLKS